MHYPAAWSHRSWLLPALLAALFLGGCVTGPKPPTVAATPDPRFEIPATNDGLPGAGPLRRADWFRQVWRERRSAWAGQIQQDQQAVVFLGDSITQGWGEGLVGYFPGVKVANRGISGDTTRGVLIRLAADVSVLHPAGVVLLIGTNDLEEGAAPEVIAANISLIIAALRQQNPAMPVVLCAILPSSATKQRPAAEIQRTNRLLQAIVRDQPQVTYLDTWTLFADAQGDATLPEFPDLLHPNAAGYAKWAGAIRPVLATLGFLDTVSDNFRPEPGFVSLFNGRDLTGWGYRPTTAQDIAGAAAWRKADPEGAAAWPVVPTPVSFDGRPATPDGRFVAQHGRLVVTTPHEGRKIQQLWTTRTFPQDFILKMEFRATPNTDSGIYVRGPQLQCRDYLLAGPYKELKLYRPGEWNEIVITVKGGTAHCTCNGELLEDAMPIPADGPIGVEGDRGQMEYRRIRIQLLP